MSDLPTTTDAEAEAARVALAAELRRGMHLVVGREPSTAEMQALTEQLQAVFDQLEKMVPRDRGAPWGGAIEDQVPADGEPFPDSMNRPVSGSGNPFAVPMTMYRQGEMVVSTVTLEDAFEGAPGRSHGGLVSAIFDDLFGSLPMLHNKIAFTGSLTVNYVGPSPVRAPVTFRGWIDRVEGKKLFIEGDAHHGDDLVTTASAVFIDATDYIRKVFGSGE